MARYTKTYLTQGASCTTGRASPAHQCLFIGWDDVAQGQPATEATNVGDLNKPLSARDVARFEALPPGMARTVDGIEYFREW